MSTSSVCVVAVVTAAPALADRQARVEAQRQLEIVAAAVRDNHEQLRQCYYVASGRAALLDSEIGDVEGEALLTVYTDYDGQRIRWERVWPMREKNDLAGNARLVPGAWHPASYEGRWVKSPAGQSNVLPGTRGGPMDVVLLKPDDLVGVRANEPFDVRIVGFSSRLKWTSFAALEELLARLQKLPVSNVKQVGGRLLEFTISHADGNDVYSFDVEQGRLPVAVVYRNSDATVFECETSWRQRSGIWLPESYRQVRYNVSSAPPQAYERIELAFDWKVVNESVADAVFDPQTLSQTPYRYVIDATGDRPVTLEKVVPPGREPQPRTVVVPARPNSLKLILIGNAVFLALFAALLGFRLWRRSRSPAAPPSSDPQ